MKPLPKFYFKLSLRLKRSIYSNRAVMYYVSCNMVVTNITKLAILTLANVISLAIAVHAVYQESFAKRNVCRFYKSWCILHFLVLFLFKKKWCNFVVYCIVGLSLLCWHNIKNNRMQIWQGIIEALQKNYWKLK